MKEAGVSGRKKRVEREHRRQQKKSQSRREALEPQNYQEEVAF